VSAKFVLFTDVHTKDHVLVNPDHVRTAYENGPNMVRLVMDRRAEGSIEGGFNQDVAGDLKSVWATLTEKRAPVSKSPSDTPKTPFERS
jgi:hypothetical protein